MSSTRKGTTLIQAREWLREYDAMLTEWRELNSISKAEMKASEFKRYNTITTILTMREQSTMDVLRAVVLTELDEVRA